MKAFTLVEILIVIVIIGILIAAFTPKLQGMQIRARDTARKSDLSYIGSAFTVYYTDIGRYPGTVVGGNSSVGNITDLQQQLIPTYLKTIPLDPNTSRYFSGVTSNIANTTSELGTPGSYRYSTVYRNGREGHGFVLMAATEDAGSNSNYIYNVISANGAVTNINKMSDYDDIKSYMCMNGVTRGLATNVSNCVVNKKLDQLRYIYIF